MPKALDNWLTHITRPIGLPAMIGLVRHSALRSDGWFRSVRFQLSVDAQGNPIPWITYPAIDFLEPRLSTSFSVFEYGAGASTLWWASKVRAVRTVEHDSNWVDAIRCRAPTHVELLHRPLTPVEHYAHAATETDATYDVVFVDGRHRARCLEAAATACGEHGVIILDNSDRVEYHEAVSALAQLKFRRIDFHGMTPIVPRKSSTTIFYRDANVLGI